jgi:hypothetical protein
MPMANKFVDTHHNSTQIDSNMFLVVILRELCPCSIRVEKVQKCHRQIHLSLEHALSSKVRN